MTEFRITAKNGTTFDTDNDSLAKSLRKQGHQVVEIAAGAPAGETPKKASAARTRTPKKPAAEPAAPAGTPAPEAE